MSVSAREGVPADAINIHATVVLLGDHGVAILGASGAGKTSLALALICRWRALGRFARLVADDQAFVFARNDRLLCLTPAAIAGMVEFRGLGPRGVAFEPGAVIDIVVELLDAGQSARLEPPATLDMHNVQLPLLRLPARNAAGAVESIAALLA